jgi:hypothetical protein
MALIAGDHLGAGVLIGPHHVAPLFQVEPAGEHRRVHQVTEQHRELAAFGLWRMRGGWRRSTLGRWLFPPFSHLRWWPGFWGRYWRGARPSGPHQTPPILLKIPLVGVEQFFFEGVKLLVIEVELDLQGAIGHPAPLSEENQDVVEHSIKVHHRPSTRASAASAWGSQKVIAMARYRVMATVSSM